MFHKNKIWRGIAIICLVIILYSVWSISAFAHSGRTDSSGGHKDNQNKSGLGYYHYHCGGHPPHLHKNGVCPYSSSSKSQNSGSSKNSSSNSGSNITTVNPIRIQNKVSAINAGEKHQLAISTSDSSSILSCASSDLAVATISKEGMIQAISPGKTTITITNTTGKTQSFTVTIKEVFASSIAFASEQSEMLVGESFTAQIVFSPENTTNKQLAFSSSDETIISIKDGVLTALAEGQATVTATTANQKKVSLPITVSQINPMDIEVASVPITLYLEETRPFSYEILPENTTNKAVTMAYDKNIIAIDENNVITALALGETSVLLSTHNGIQKTIQVTVLPIPVSEVTIAAKGEASSKRIFRLSKNEQLPLQVITAPNNATFTDYTWSIADSSIAKIQEDSVVFAGYGKTKITVTSGSVTDTIEVHFYNATLQEILKLSILLLVILGASLVVLWYFKRKKKLEASLTDK